MELVTRLQWTALLLAGLAISCTADDEGVLADGPPTGTRTGVIQTIDSVPTFTIGSDAQPLGRITSLLLLDSATLIVADGMGPQLTRHDVSSGATTVIGRSGSGPGEFRDLCCLFQWDDDLIAAYDSRQRKLSLISASGEFVASGDLVGEPLSFLVPLSRFSGDSMVVRIERLSRPGIGVPGEMHRDSVHYALYSADVRGNSIRFRRGRTITTGLGPMRFMPRNDTRAFAVPRGPDRVDAAGTGLLLVADAATGSFQLIDPSGTVEPSEQPAPASLESDDVSRLLEAAVARSVTGPDAGREADVRSFWEATLAEMPELSHAPVFSAAVLEAGGGVWLQSWSSAPGEDEYAEWYVYRRDGTSAGKHRLPADFRPMYIDADRIVGLHTDDYDVQTVRGYRIKRSQ